VFARCLLSAVCAATGCGLNQSSDYPHRLIGADGQLFFLEDLEEIANDPDLTDDEKREQFRELGLEDEKLIEALLEL
jgi:hypothetical protein